MSSFSKRELVVEVSNRTGLSQGEVSKVLETSMETIIKSLAQGRDVSLRRFGIFRVKLRRARQAHSPKAPGQSFAIPARAVVKFRAGLEMKKRVEQGTPELMKKQEAEDGRASPPPAASSRTASPKPVAPSPAPKKVKARRSKPTSQAASDGQQQLGI